MPIKVSHQPAAAVLGESAAVGGQEELARYLDQLSLRQAQLSEEAFERLQRRDLAQQEMDLRQQAFQEEARQQERRFAMDELGIKENRQRRLMDVQLRQLQDQRDFEQQKELATFQDQMKRQAELEDEEGKLDQAQGEIAGLYEPVINDPRTPQDIRKLYLDSSKQLRKVELDEDKSPQQRHAIRRQILAKLGRIAQTGGLPRPQTPQEELTASLIEDPNNPGQKFLRDPKGGFKPYTPETPRGDLEKIRTDAALEKQALIEDNKRALEGMKQELAKVKADADAAKAEAAAAKDFAKIVTDLRAATATVDDDTGVKTPGDLEKAITEAKRVAEAAKAFARGPDKAESEKHEVKGRTKEEIDLAKQAEAVYERSKAAGADEEYAKQEADSWLADQRRHQRAGTKAPAAQDNAGLFNVGDYEGAQQPVTGDPLNVGRTYTPEQKRRTLIDRNLILSTRGQAAAQLFDRLKEMGFRDETAVEIVRREPLDREGLDLANLRDMPTGLFKSGSG